MKSKAAKKEVTDKSKVPFLGLLTPEQISEGAAKFRNEVSSKLRLKAAKN